MQEKIEALRNRTVAPQALFIDGNWREPVEGAALDVISPIDGRRLTTIADAGAVDVDRAVKAARAAFEKAAGPRRRPPSARRCC